MRCSFSGVRCLAIYIASQSAACSVGVPLRLNLIPVVFIGLSDLAFFLTGCLCVFRSASRFMLPGQNLRALKNGCFFARD